MNPANPAIPGPGVPGPTSAPSARLLGGFCRLAGRGFEDLDVDAWLKADKASAGIWPGRFGPEELHQISKAAPAVLASCLAVASAQAAAGGGVECDFRLAAVAIGARTARNEPDGAQARRLAERLCYELGRRQQDAAGRNLWPLACFSDAELDPARADRPRWRDAGDPREIRAANLYDAKLHDRRIALWAVTWTQRFRALPPDFELPDPELPGIPGTVLAGYAPRIGPAHEQDYAQAAPRPEAG